MNETPEAVRDRIKAEELAKGSDPRVAEGRSKAAEMRTRLGLPINPQEAWKARLAQEGGAPAPAAPAAAPAAPAPAAPAAPASDAATPAPRTDTGPTHVPPDSSGAGESPAPSASDAPLAPQTQPQTQPQTPPQTPPPPEAGPPVAAVPEPLVVAVFAPEVGELIELEDEVVFSVGGVKVRDARIATWILILLLSIPLWAMLYLLGLGGGDVGRATTGCIVEADRSFVCFQPKHETGSGGGH